MDNEKWSYFGFIAEEVAKVDPRLVQWKEEDGVLVPEGVDYLRIFTLMFKSYVDFRKQAEEVVIQLRKEIEELKMRMEAESELE